MRPLGTKISFIGSPYLVGTLPTGNTVWEFMPSKFPTFPCPLVDLSTPLNTLRVSPPDPPGYWSFPAKFFTVLTWALRDAVCTRWPPISHHFVPAGRGTMFSFTFIPNPLKITQIVRPSLAEVTHFPQGYSLLVFSRLISFYFFPRGRAVVWVPPGLTYSIAPPPRNPMCPPRGFHAGLPGTNILPFFLKHLLFTPNPIRKALPRSVVASSGVAVFLSFPPQVPPFHSLPLVSSKIETICRLTHVGPPNGPQLRAHAPSLRFPPPDYMVLSVVAQLLFLLVPIVDSFSSPTLSDLLLLDCFVQVSPFLPHQTRNSIFFPSSVHSPLSKPPGQIPPSPFLHDCVHPLHYTHP